MRFQFSLGLVLPILFIQLQLEAAVTYQTVTLSGDAAPGTASDILLSTTISCPPRIDSTGRVGFDSYLTGNGVNDTNNHAIWYGSPDDLHLLARTGDPAPGFDSAQFKTLGCVKFTNAGFSAFDGTAGIGTTSDEERGLWLADVNQTTLIVRNMTEPPGFPGTVFESPRIAGISASGTVAVWSTLIPLNNAGMWAGTPGSLQLIARSDLNPSDGSDPFFLSNGRANNAGQGVLKGVLGSTGGIWLKSDAGVELVALKGNQAPQLPSGVVFSNFTAPRISDDGTVAFSAGLGGEAITTANGAAIWAGYPGALNLLARKGSQAPDTSPGTLITGVLNPPTLNREGVVAFTAMMEGGDFAPGDMGLWMGTPSAPKLVVDTATPVITTPDGDLELQFFISDPAMNGRGDVAFFAVLEGPRVTANNRRSLWVRGHDGALLLIARDGDRFDVGGGDVRTIQNLHYFQDGTDPTIGDSYFNDAGQLAFELTFTDGSTGLFIAIVPEPVFLSLLLPLGCFLSRSRRR